MNTIIIAREECTEPAPVKLVVECDPLVVNVPPKVSDDTAMFFAYLSDDTLRRVHDALVEEWLRGYNGPRDEFGLPVTDDVSWDKAHENDDMRRVTEDFINRTLLMREAIAQGK